MKNLPPELMYGLIFAAILLYQFLMKRMAPQQPQESALDEPQLEMPEELEEIPVSSPAPKLAVDLFGRTEAPRATLR
ncbi:MAG: hypothetical protein IH605_20820, partial [Burkholderiales bacterium]|nr:hypothetical protein [Burkholderiales bacterium]